MPRRATVVPTIVFGWLALLAWSAPVRATDDLVFIHHSVGSNWLATGLDHALVAKIYINQRNDITYGTVLLPDPGRPASLGSVPGDNTNMNHWIRWFNDYLGRVKTHQVTSGVNRIIMFKSCYPISDISADGTEPGDPFAGSQTFANYKAVYRHPAGAGQVYSSGGYAYKPLEDVFAENPDTLFIPVTAPPLNYTSTTDASAHRARMFNNWLKTEWLAGYNQRHPGLRNVAVFDFFDVLAYADTDLLHPNRLKGEYGGATSDSHPTAAGSTAATEAFATSPGNFIDAAWTAFQGGPRAARHDYDGDGVSDIAVFRPSNGAWFIRTSGGAAVAAAWGTAGDIPVPGDYDGDHKTDLAVWRPATGAWYIVHSATGATVGTRWGALGDTPVPADYDGDGKTDLAVFRPSTGAWYIAKSGGGGSVGLQWGADGDVPEPADYDGDGKADLAVFRPSTSAWYVVKSTGGAIGLQWGTAGDVPMVADYDGDGKADIGVFRPSASAWFIIRSTGGSAGFLWGTPGDRPAFGDFDGDHKEDVAVFRESTGTWYISKSGGGSVGVGWGTVGDIPV